MLIHRFQLSGSQNPGRLSPRVLRAQLSKLLAYQSDEKSPAERTKEHCKWSRDWASTDSNKCRSSGLKGKSSKSKFPSLGPGRTAVRDRSKKAETPRDKSGCAFPPTSTLHVLLCMPSIRAAPQAAFQELPGPATKHIKARGSYSS